MKKPEVYLKEFAHKLSDDNLRYLHGRLTQRINGDFAEAVQFLSDFKEIDKWFLSASDCNEFYDMVDLVYFALNKEHEKRLGVPA
jgi:Ni,Fe-hydrogenase III component G